jgi:hypothetical protein
MEPEFTKAISNRVVCNFFFIFFVIYAIFTAISVLGLIGMLTFLKVPKGVMIAQSFYALLVVALAGTQMLFHYLICDRALQPSTGKKVVRDASESMDRSQF